jgi:hypothetical protein
MSPQDVTRHAAAYQYYPCGAVLIGADASLVGVKSTHTTDERETARRQRESALTMTGMVTSSVKFRPSITSMSHQDRMEDAREVISALTEVDIIVDVAVDETPLLYFVRQYDGATRKPSFTIHFVDHASRERARMRMGDIPS